MRWCLPDEIAGWVERQRNRPTSQHDGHRYCSTHLRRFFFRWSPGNRFFLSKKQTYLGDEPTDEKGRIWKAAPKSGGANRREEALHLGSEAIAFVKQRERGMVNLTGRRAGIGCAPVDFANIG